MFFLCTLCFCHFALPAMRRPTPLCFAGLAPALLLAAIFRGRAQRARAPIALVCFIIIRGRAQRARAPIALVCFIIIIIIRGRAQRARAPIAIVCFIIIIIIIIILFVPLSLWQPYEGNMGK